MKNKRDLWIEMSIRETWTQCRFAEIAYSHINPKARRPTDLVFSSIHSFLSHCAMVSKMLKARYSSTPKSFFAKLLETFRRNKRKNPMIGQILSVPLSSVVHNRNFRNSLEHYDKELKKWIKKYPPTINIGTHNIGPKSMFKGNIVFVSHYDPTNDTFTFVDDDFNLGELNEEVSEIKNLADGWIKKVERGILKTPFI